VSDDLPREEVESAVDRLIEELFEKAGLEKPPVDALALAQRHLGLTVAFDPEGQPRGRARRAGGRAAIRISPDSTEEQKQWAAAHAVGEHLKPSLLERLGVEGQRGGLPGASLANLLATRLLLPSGWFGADAPAAEYDLERLHALYRTATPEAIALRLLDLPEPCIIAVIDNDHVRRRRSNAWPVRRELSPAEQECQRYVTRYSRPKVVAQGGWTVWGWPVHRPDWKREILRSVVEDEAWETGPPRPAQDDELFD
jgi:hypothetical protein